ncbi:iron reductase domain protein, partial [Sphaerobolus stellatus SS14]
FFDSENGINFQAFKDPVHSVTFGLINFFLDPHGGNSARIIAEIISPVVNKWVGLSIGGAMLNSLLLEAWPNADAIVSSARFTPKYGLPTAYVGPTLTTLPSSNIDDTHWKWICGCENCTSW